MERVSHDMDQGGRTETSQYGLVDVSILGEVTLTGASCQILS